MTESTPESQLLAAIRSGKGLAAAKEALKADGLEISTARAKELIDLLKTEIADRQAMIGALELYIP